MTYTLLPQKRKRIVIKDYGKYLIWFEDVDIAKHAQDFLDEKKINYSRMYDEIGFATNKIRLKALKLLRKHGYGGILV